MIEAYCIVVFAKLTDSLFSDNFKLYDVKEFQSYPTTQEIKDVVDQWDNKRHEIKYAKVEKRYKWEAMESEN